MVRKDVIDKQVVYKEGFTMFRNFKNTFKVIRFLSLVLLTTFFVTSIKPDATVAASFGHAKGDSLGYNHQFTFVNHSNVPIEYDLEPATGEKDIKGSVQPGKTIDTRTIDTDNSIEKGNVNVIFIPGVPTNPGFWFHSGNNGAVQYINLLGGDGWKVTKDTSEISELTGNGFRVTVDGGGVFDPKIDSIHIQIYNS